MEAFALQAPAAPARTRISIGAPLLRMRSDDQLLALFRAGNDDAFRVIHDRYRQRLFAFTRQMLSGSRHDPEDALQDVFISAYTGLRASDRELALRAWLYRVARNRCLDELRRPTAPVAAPTAVDLVESKTQDPVAVTEQRESLDRLLAHIQRLPEHQRSALLMREFGGMNHVEVADALGVTAAAVKSLLVRARLGLVQAEQARGTACLEIRDELIIAHDHRVRPGGVAKRHLRDCQGCREFRSELRGLSHQLAGLLPLGPIAVLANALGFGAAGGSAGALGTAGTAASVAIVAGTGHVTALLAAAVIVTGGAGELQHALSTPVAHRAHLLHHGAPAMTRVQAASSGEPGEAGAVAYEPISAHSSTDSVRAGVPASASSHPQSSGAHPGSQPAPGSPGLFPGNAGPPVALAVGGLGTAGGLNGGSVGPPGGPAGSSRGAGGTSSGVIPGTGTGDPAPGTSGDPSASGSGTGPTVPNPGPATTVTAGSAPSTSSSSSTPLAAGSVAGSIIPTATAKISGPSS